METLIQQLEEILEVENIDTSKKFEDFEEWDSLTTLSVIAMLDSDYKISMSRQDLLVFSSIADFCKEVLSR
ncbi:MAG: phosphopantetheine-binding protein [Bacteroidales bacterium]|jgi:acyl carrier protein|nr:phosphopantetheine-binding protein [Bacteroidales bacterium]